MQSALRFEVFVLGVPANEEIVIENNIRIKI